MKLYRIIPILFILFVASCTTINQPVPLPNGAKPIASFDAKTLEDMAKKRGIETDGFFGYDAYKLSYNTRGIDNKPLRVSGVVVLPTPNGTSKEQHKKLDDLKGKGLSIVIDCHGTIFSDTDAPSNRIADSNSPTVRASLFSGYGGFITALPDYIGFGDSRDKMHPYLVKEPSVNTVVAMLKATVSFARKNKIKLSNDVYISGYSEGGFIALSSLKALEKNGFRVRVAMPMAGPYLLDIFGKRLLAQDSYVAPSYILNMVYPYSKIYNLDINKIINKKYTKNLDELLSGKHGKQDIDRALTKKLHGKDGLISPWIEQNYDNSELREKLAKNNAINTSSHFQAKIEFARCKGDKTVPHVIAQKTQQVLQANGTNVKITMVEDALNIDKTLNHSQCFMPAYIYSADTFVKDRNRRLGIED